MAKDRVEQFLSGSATAKRAKVPARVVFRRTQTTSGNLASSFEAGVLTVGGEPSCDLIAGGTVIARGEIVEKDGSFFFQAKEANQ
jgi:flagellar motor switch/type III secretory pathway protein FliN